LLKVRTEPCRVQSEDLLALRAAEPLSWAGGDHEFGVKAAECWIFGEIHNIFGRECYRYERRAADSAF
jgi:hypothetical protein